jgi:RHS repeat-associated protein
LSKFDYTYDTVGNIQTWRQERAGSAAKKYTFTHDLVDQLTSAVLTDTNTTPMILKRQAWWYDVAGNRTVDQTDDVVYSTSHDAMNRLQSRAPGGAIVFEGSLDEPATVTVDGKPAILDAANNFRGTANLTGSTTTVTMKAKDASGNEATKQYEVDAAGATTSYAYDANGNLTGDGTKTYYWNALNQLVEVKEGTTAIATFEYDGFGRRTEKVAGGITRAYIYDAEDIVEERITGSSADTLRYHHGLGIDEPLARVNSASVVTYYLADHLGSIVQETSASGSVSLERHYDAWGVLLQGASSSGFAFTGREWDAETAIYYYRLRYYRPSIGRFLNEDPIGLLGGLNLFAYVLNSPTRFIDPLGLQNITNNTGGAGRLKPQDANAPYEDLPNGHTKLGDGLIVGDTVVKTTDYVDIIVTKDLNGNIVVAPKSPYWNSFMNWVQRQRGKEESGNKGDYHEWIKQDKHPDWTDLQHGSYCPTGRSQ